MFVVAIGFIRLNAIPRKCVLMNNQELEKSYNCHVIY